MHVPQVLHSMSVEGTLEGLFLESALALQKAELDSTKNPQNLNLINVTIDTDAQKATIAMSLPINFETTQNGGYVVAMPYLVG